MNEAFCRCIYETERICLRELRKDDLKGGYAHWFNDQEVCRFNAHGVYPASLNEMEKFIDTLDFDRSRIVWAIIDKAEGRHIGNLSLQDIDSINRTAEFAIILGEKAFGGKGYGLEASRILLTHGFNKLNLRRIGCGTAATNHAMQKLAGALKMSQEGIRRQALFLDGKYVDVCEFGVLKDEFFAR